MFPIESDAHPKGRRMNRIWLVEAASEDCVEQESKKQKVLYGGAWQQ